MENSQQYFLNDVIKEKPMICKNGGMENYFIFYEYKEKIKSLINQESLEKQAEIVNIKLEYYQKIFNSEYEYEASAEFINHYISNNSIDSDLKEYLNEEISIIQVAYDMYKLTLKK